MSRSQIILPTIKQIEDAQGKNPWDFSNKILYDLCRDNFEHNQEEIILTKVLFVGRIYAAAVEREEIKKDELNDDFYINTIVRPLKNQNWTDT